MKTIVFTLCSNNYLAQAIVLGNSFRCFYPDCEFVIGLVDKQNEEIHYEKIPFPIIEAEALQISTFDDMVERYEVIELNTALKPFFMGYFLQKGADRVMYFDPDIVLYSPIIAVDQALNENNIVLIPHTIHPIPMDGCKPQEEDLLNSGIYNLGFIAVCDSAETRKFVAWWSERLTEKAYIDFEKGLFTDQIWIDFVPLYYDKVLILRDIGYNVAYWNLHARVLSLENGVYIVKDEAQTAPLAFFHFSGYKPTEPLRLSKYQNRHRFDEREECLRVLFDEYSSKLNEANYTTFAQFPCFYAEKKQFLASKQKKQKDTIYYRLLRRCNKLINSKLKKGGVRFLLLL